jgi:N-methylhydantoinase A
VAALRREGFAGGDIAVRREADAKFAGQSFEISLSWPDDPITEEDRAGLATGFIAEYERVYGPGSAWEGFPIELHTARVVASGKTKKPPVVTEAASAGPQTATPSGEREIRLGGETLRALTYDGPALSPGHALSGPALIDDVDTTLLVPAGARLEIDELRNYVFTVAQGVLT